MPIGSRKQAAVPTTPSSFNSPSPRVHDPHGPPDLHPRTRAYLLAPGLQTPDVSSEGPDEARAGRGGGGERSTVEYGVPAQLEAFVSTELVFAADTTEAY